MTCEGLPPTRLLCTQGTLIHPRASRTGKFPCGADSSSFLYFLQPPDTIMSLCSPGLSSANQVGACTAGSSTFFHITSVDKYNNPRLSGGDDWSVKFDIFLPGYGDAETFIRSSQEGESSELLRRSVEVGGEEDNVKIRGREACASGLIANLGNGTYLVRWQTTCSGRYWLSITLGEEGVTPR